MTRQTEDRKQLSWARAHQWLHPPPKSDPKGKCVHLRAREPAQRGPDQALASQRGPTRMFSWLLQSDSTRTSACALSLGNLRAIMGHCGPQHTAPVSLMSLI